MKSLNFGMLLISSIWKFYLLFIIMNKHLIRATLWLMGMMGTLAIWVVNAETTTVSEPYWHINYTLNGNENFEAQVITITDWTDTITILDRNLWATTAWTWCEDPNWLNSCIWWDPTYWYHFQWWNNHWFKWCDLSGSTYNCSDTITSSAVNWQVNATTISYDPANQVYYESGAFYKGYDGNWLNDNSKVDLWWWGMTDSTDTTYSLSDDTWKVNLDTVTSRQWPCPEWFHVPSRWELDKLRNLMWNSASDIHTKLLIPFAGWRDPYDALAYNLGVYANLWSSSPISASNSFSRYFYLLVYVDLDITYHSRADANSVRCFYDFYQPFPQSLTLSFTGSEWGSVSTWSIEAEKWSSISRDNEAGSVTISWTVVATGIADEWYVFSWWLTDCGATLTANCTFTGEFKPIPYTITYLWTEDDYTPSATGYTIESSDIILSQPSKSWYTFTWRSGTKLASLTQTVEIPAWSTWDRTYEANWEAIEYEIIYELNWWVNSPNNVTWYTIESNITFENPTKDWYSFDGWFTDAQFTTWITAISTWTTWPITVYAKWNENKKPSWGSSGWGGRRSSTTTPESSTETLKDKNTEDVIQSETKWSEESSNTPMDSSANASEWQTYTQEFQEAYEFAKEKGITTMPTIQKADMDGKLTRIAMAKMLSQYAMNVLWQKPANVVTPKFKDVTDKENSDYDDGVTLAYQLWIMWQNMPDNKFRPNDEVTRAEFATALSRMIYNTSDGEYKATPKYYIHHMDKLVKEWIITNDNPNMKELGWYAMIMMMRSAGK